MKLTTAKAPMTPEGRIGLLIQQERDQTIKIIQGPSPRYNVV